MNPQIVQLYSRGETKAVQSLVYDNFRWNFSLYWLIALPLLFEADYILKIWLVEVPEQTTIFMRIIILRSLVKCFERPINSLNFAIGDMKGIYIFASISVFITVVVLYLLFKLGLPAYWAFILDVICVAICTCFYMNSARKHQVFAFSYFVGRVFLPILTTILISAVITYFVRFTVIVSDFLQLIITLITATVITALSLWYIVFSKDNRKKIIGIVQARLARQVKSNKHNSIQ